jgi:hypothetical protein
MGTPYSLYYMCVLHVCVYYMCVCTRYTPHVCTRYTTYTAPPSTLDTEVM